MGELLSYSISSGALLLILYAVYKTVLANEKNHSCNRAVLWGICAFAFIVYPVAATFTGGEVPMTGTGFVGGNLTVDAEPARIGFMRVLLWIYAAGIAVTVCHTILMSIRLAVIISKGNRVKAGHYTLVVTKDEGMTPFSWLRYIVMSRKDYGECADLIMAHETQHLKLHHWVDLLAAQIIVVINWYNPAAWFVRKEFKIVHEYQVDDRVVSGGTDMRRYQMLLIRKTVDNKLFAMANGFNHGMLKKRIEMMHAMKPSAKSRFKLLALVPSVVLAVLAVNTPMVGQVVESASRETMTVDSVVVGNGTSVDAEPIKVVGSGTIVKDRNSKNVPVIVIRNRSDSSNVASSEVEIYVDGERIHDISEVNPRDIESVAVGKDGKIQIKMKK